MGLELAEILMDVEDAFGIRLEEGVRFRTVSDLCDRVAGQVPLSAAPACLTASLFWRLRRALVDLYGHERRAIRPSTPLPPLIPRRARRQHWRRLELALGLALPPLERPLLVRWAILGLTSLTLLCGLRMCPSSSPSWLPYSLALNTLLLVWLISVPLMDLPSRLQTVGDAARHLISRNPVLVRTMTGGFTRDQIQAIVTQIIADRLGLPVQRVTPAADLVRDLGAG